MPKKQGFVAGKPPGLRPAKGRPRRVSARYTAVGQSFRDDLADLPEPYQGPPVANAPLHATEVPEKMSLPEGFTATLFARGLEGPRQGYVLPNSDLLVSMQEGGYIALLRDTDQDGEADIISRAFEPVTGPYGVTHRDWTDESDFDYEILIADLEGIWSQPYKTPNIRNVGARNQTVDETPIEERKPLYDFSGQSLLREGADRTPLSVSRNGRRPDRRSAPESRRPARCAGSRAPSRARPRRSPS